jgi:mono/diheme cytochrome c family protein
MDLLSVRFRPGRVYKQHCALCHGLPDQPPIDYVTNDVPEATATVPRKRRDR